MPSSACSQLQCVNGESMRTQTVCLVDYRWGLTANSCHCPGNPLSS